ACARAPSCRSMRAARRSSSRRAPSSAASTWAPRSYCCCLRAGASSCARSPPAAACGWARRSPGSREADVSGGGDWRPSASRALLERRAALLACTREFFAARGVLEVDTPVVVNAPVSDVHIVSATVQLGRTPAYLHTSPEYAMKRLLAAGSGDIYQVCHVVRGAESGRLHNPEFTLIEWYRVGFPLAALMDEVEALVRLLLGPAAAPRASERISYRDAFLRELGLDPLTAPDEALEEAARPLGFTDRSADRDAWLELLMGSRVGPRLGRSALTFVHGYPASQAALARLDPADPRTARLRGSAEGELGRLLFPQGRAARGRALSGPSGVRADRARLGRVRHGGGAAPHARRARRARVPGPYRLRSGVALGDRGAAHRRRRARWVAARGARSRQSARGALRRGRRPRARVARRALRAEHPGDERARESRMTVPRSGTRGLAAGSAAFAIWGLFPLYLHPLSGVPATQVIAHRVAWSCLFLLGWMLLRGQLGRLTATLTNPALLV